jgi:hypothetical protein
VRHEGHIIAGGVEKEVTFTDADHKLEEAIDTAYPPSIAAMRQVLSTQ